MRKGGKSTGGPGTVTGGAGKTAITSTMKPVFGKKVARAGKKGLMRGAGR
jgi:hypothetical protein